VLRREIDILSRPVVTEEAEEPAVEEIVEEPPPATEPVEEKMEEVNGVPTEDQETQVKNEEEEMGKEDDLDDEEGLFSREFDLMDPNIGYQSESMGFDSWMTNM
jgi:hypothetical protein